jgi:hypothetical protein
VETEIPSLSKKRHNHEGLQQEGGKVAREEVWMVSPWVVEVIRLEGEGPKNGWGMDG